jgi:hypothetical protein
MNDLVTFRYQCASCGEENETAVDASAGDAQSFTEDCTVCCRPNLLHVRIGVRGDVQVDVEFDE